MAYTTIDDPSAYFQTKIYAGTDASPQAFTLDGNSDLQPDWVWIKNRGYANKHVVFDSVRGVEKSLTTNSTAAEVNQNADGGYLSAFNSDGFTLTEGSSSDNDTNDNRYTYVAWNWKETADAGFDIVSYTGSGSAKTVAHNLGVKPDVIICKSRSGAEEWRPYFSALGATYGMRLNGTNAKDDDAGYWNDVEPTSSVFTVGTNAGTNGNNVTFIAYCFAEKKGYSKFGSYTGNNNTNGPFVYTGFKPAWLMIKRTDTENTATNMNGSHWVMLDNKRDPINAAGAAHALTANRSAAEDTSNLTKVDFLSNGFKFRGGADAVNAAATYIYMAFAEQPFVTSTGVPATAR